MYILYCDCEKNKKKKRKVVLLLVSLCCSNFVVRYLLWGLVR